MMCSIQKFAVYEDQEQGRRQHRRRILHELPRERKAQAGREHPKDESNCIGHPDRLSEDFEAGCVDEIGAGRRALKKITVDRLPAHDPLGSHPEINLIAAEQERKPERTEEIQVKINR